MIRDMGWLHFALPERKCQTEQRWGNEFGLSAASLMWGLHIGIGFATRVRYCGFWALCGVVFVFGEGRLGAIALGGYWLARTLPVWTLPVMFKEVWNHFVFLESVNSYDDVHRRLNQVVLIGGALVSAAGLDACKLAFQRVFGGISVLYLSYLPLVVIACFCSYLLLTVLSETAALRQERDRDADSRPLLPGQAVPEFTVAVLGESRRVTAEDLSRRRAMLLFVRPEDGAGAIDRVRLGASVHMLWHKAKGNLDIVCNGPEEQCEQLAASIRRSFPKLLLRVLLDQDGTLTREFKVRHTPVAYRLGDANSIVGVGRQIN
jgi:hypothetical protein